MPTESDFNYHLAMWREQAASDESDLTQADVAALERHLAELEELKRTVAEKVKMISEFIQG